MLQASFYDDLSFENKQIEVKKILETSNSSEIRIVMPSGQVMKKHKSTNLIIVQVLKGEIQFHVNDEILRMPAGKLVSLEPGVEHSLHAEENSVIRLSVLK